LSSDIFGDVDKSKLRLSKPLSGTPPKWVKDNEPEKPNHDIRRLKELSKAVKSSGNRADYQGLEVGQVIMHERFGKGKILNLEGAGADKKAEIQFEVGGIKKLLLRFAKLDVIS